MTPEEWSLICEAIICGFSARRGDKDFAVDTEVAEQMRDIYWYRMKVTES
jgi:hypothetical protein